MYLPSVVPDRAEVADRTRHAVHRKPTKQPLYERGKCKGSARCSCCSREVLQESPREKVKAQPNKGKVVRFKSVSLADQIIV